MSAVEAKRIAELNKRKVPIIVIDESLDKYDDIILFPEKLQRANETLAKTGHPEKYLKQK